MPIPRGGFVRCARACTHPAHVIVTYCDGSETALCVDHYLALLRYDEPPLSTVRGLAAPDD